MSKTNATPTKLATAEADLRYPAWTLRRAFVKGAEWQRQADEEKKRKAEKAKKRESEKMAYDEFQKEINR